MPDDAALEKFRRQGEHSLLDVDGGDQVVRAAPFEAVALDLGRWWLDDDEDQHPSS